MDEAQLNPDEVARYARHIVLREIGGAGQQKLKAARVLVLGAGGLGSPVLSYLAAAGVGLLGIIDDDHVSLSNLQRQILHDTAHIGMAKTESAARALRRLNPHSRVITHELRLTAANAVDILTGYDLVVDGSDTIETRYLLADTCETLKIPLVTAAVGRFDGSVTVLTPYETGADGTPCPRYRDLFPEAPPPGMMPSCAEAGVIGALTGVIGTLEAMEVIKLITGAGEPLIGRLLLYDGLNASFQTVRYARKG
ncbi:molybdopterin-synthase adenylyltransferase MoeB [Hoeflea ulvae]|uniref:Molybdopterin-synthase adenylyltransferase MoeB n=1 Tax=Hoeflea ulvae TaxID=2983764 RepID=A0ABT3YB65_9HYPH|nr:molybdopterin-synthase adenylyltransferase MoeB [Hoeflea ulvae]MCY0093126.1 molybdopterin-synthase adenylyltransferase MoeB [Hoeflea ulvae]